MTWPNDSGTWADRVIAHPQGYARAVLFPRARDALNRYTQVRPEEVISLPICVCPEIAVQATEFLDVDECGMAPGTQLYGFRKEHTNDLDLDPLMTGWWMGATNLHRIVSFGPNKILPLVGGGAFLTNDPELAEKMDEYSFFPGGECYAKKVTTVFQNLEEVVYRRRSMIKMWDRYLGDLLERIPCEQVMPWNVMRLAAPEWRYKIVTALRHGGIAVSTNYPRVDFDPEMQGFPGFEGEPDAWRAGGGLWWESRVISFPLYDASDVNCEHYVNSAAAIIHDVLYGCGRHSTK